MVVLSLSQPGSAKMCGMVLFWLLLRIGDEEEFPLFLGRELSDDITEFRPGLEDKPFSDSGGDE